MKVLEQIISLYAPLSCLGCRAEGSIICLPCIRSLPCLTERCYHCDAQSVSGRICLSCRATGQFYGLTSANAAVAYEGLAKDLVWRLKFGRVQSAADCMATLMVERYGSRITNDTLIVAVPTANKRVRSRGYDQAVLIAKAFAKRTGCQYTTLLLRCGSQEQIGAGKAQRHKQLQGAFLLKNATVIPDARILLIDDVMTTGATLETAAAILKHAGARVVGSLVFAKAEARPG